MNTDLVQADTTLATRPRRRYAGTAARANRCAGRRFCRARPPPTRRLPPASRAARSTTGWARISASRPRLNRGRRDLRQALAAAPSNWPPKLPNASPAPSAEGDVKAALEILRRANVFTASKIGSDNEAVLQLEEQKRQLDRENDLAISRHSHKSVSRDY